MRIALIDDNEIDIFVNKKLIETSDIQAELVAYNNPLDALQTLEKESIDVVIVDNQMPEISGHGFLEKLIDFRIATPTMIVLTASVHDELRLKYESLHPDILLWEKPLNVENLNSLLAKI